MALGWDIGIVDVVLGHNIEPNSVTPKWTPSGSKWTEDQLANWDSLPAFLQ